MADDVPDGKPSFWSANYAKDLMDTAGIEEDPEDKNALSYNKINEVGTLPSTSSTLPTCEHSSPLLWFFRSYRVPHPSWELDTNRCDGHKSVRTLLGHSVCRLISWRFFAHAFPSRIGCGRVSWSFKPWMGRRRDVRVFFFCTERLFVQA